MQETAATEDTAIYGLAEDWNAGRMFLVTLQAEMNAFIFSDFFAWATKHVVFARAGNAVRTQQVRHLIHLSLFSDKGIQVGFFVWLKGL